MSKRFEDFNEEAKKYRAILVNYKEKGEVFVDPNFHPIAKIPEKAVSFNDSDVEWLRIDEVYKAPLFKKELIHYDFVQQGTLPDCYLLSVISHLSQQPSLIPFLFDNKANIYLGKVEDSINIKCGAVVIFFHAFGRKTPVLIDTLIPFIKGTSTPLFSRPSDTTKSPWFCLVEKAYAKLNESYTELAGGTFGQAIYSIFGFSCSMKNLSTLKSQDKATKMAPFERILKYQKHGAIIGAGIHTEKLEDITDEELTQKGLITVHSYLLLKTKQYDNKNFLCLRNPWGGHEWNGDWSDHSNLWTPELKEGVGMNPCEDGTFWMIDHDFFRYFTEIDVGLPIPSKWHSRHFFYQLNPGSYDDENVSTEEAFNLNLPRYAFQVSEKFNEMKKCHLHIICERRHKILDDNGQYNNPPPPYCIELKSRHLVTVRLYRLTGQSSIISFPYDVGNNDEMLVIQLRRLAPTDLIEDCCVKIFCELDFKLIDVNSPRTVIQEDPKVNSIFDNLATIKEAPPVSNASPNSSPIQNEQSTNFQQQENVPNHPIKTFQQNQPKQQPNKTPTKQQQQPNMISKTYTQQQHPNKTPTQQQQQQPNMISKTSTQQQQQPNMISKTSTQQQQQPNMISKTPTKQQQQPNMISKTSTQQQQQPNMISKDTTKQSQQQMQQPNKTREDNSGQRSNRDIRTPSKPSHNQGNIPQTSPSRSKFKTRVNLRHTETPLSKPKMPAKLAQNERAREAKKSEPEQNVHKVPKPKPPETIDLNDKSMRKMYNSISSSVLKKYLS
ncbi:hypothetical protein M9Y10_029497 [Tritrichomonas musculus]|uniref:Calpain catalytic domain-containing protein n=1 Tax=Tritrichomonas musculus TaxID=1915356 RepID=A0ABR2KMX7_9EUKA